jgi:YesN/AraC family two-component response regulator
MFRQSLKDLLTSRFPDVEVEEAEDGKGAVRKINAHLPDIIFMDIKLPGVNGLTLTKKIKAEFKGIVVIVLTSYDLPGSFLYQRTCDYRRTFGFDPVHPDYEKAGR